MSVLTQPLDLKLPLPLERLAEVCRRHDVEELSVFGSALRDDFTPASDLDFLVVFLNNDAGPWMSKFDALERDLSELLGRPVEVADKHGVEQDLNWLRRRRILASAAVIYAD